MYQNQQPNPQVGAEDIVEACMILFLIHITQFLQSYCFWPITQSYFKKHKLQKGFYGSL
jgi:hypothetical protein